MFSIEQSLSLLCSFLAQGRLPIGVYHYYFQIIQGDVWKICDKEKSNFI